MIIPSTFQGTDRLLVITPLTFLNYSHGLRASNNDEEFYRSRLDEETTSFIIKDIGIGAPRDTGFMSGEMKAINSQVGNLSARYVQDAPLPLSFSGAFNDAQDFEIEHEFRIQDYSAQDIQNYLENIKTENYLGANTLDYNSSLEFRVIETNPETSKVGKFVSAGNVGFFNENINGRVNIFSVSDLKIIRFVYWGRNRRVTKL